MEYLINGVVFWPFVGAGFTWLIGREKKNSVSSGPETAVCGADGRRNLGAAITVALELFLAGLLFANYSRGNPSLMDLGGTVSEAVCLKGICGRGIGFGTDGFRVMYVLITAFMWFVSTLFSFSYMKHYKNKNRYYFFLLLTMGATTGVFLSADFFTMFLFFEIMSFASYVWVAQDEKKESLRAAQTYLAIAVIGGLCILMGMFLLYGETGTLSTMGPLTRDRSLAASGRGGIFGGGRLWAAGLLMLVGFGAKAGAVPFHIWLPKAHPAAPAPASALLSGVLTKTGVYGTMLLTLRLFFGNTAFGQLIYALGVLTMVTGAVLALFSVDIKRTLACSSVSQIGFIFTGVGMAGMFTAKEMAYGEGCRIALGGAIFHMVNHSLLKLLLFCAAGVVFLNVHRLNLNDIRGFGRKKPLLHGLFLVGALGLSGVPFFNGYVSKSLLHEGIVLWQEIQESLWIKGSEWLFIISGGLTAAYMAKLYIALFWEKNEKEALQKEYEGKRKYMDRLTGILLSITGVFVLAAGIIGGVVWKVFSWESIRAALLSLAIGVVAYLFVVRKYMMKGGVYVNRWNPEWDLENRIYRPLLAGLSLILSVSFRFLDRLPDYLVLALRKTVYRDSPLPHELEEGDALTHAVGTLLDDGRKALNRTIYKKHPIGISFEHKLAMVKEELKENNTMIGRSLSFGLLLFCMGLLFTLLYMLFT